MVYSSVWPRYVVPTPEAPLSLILLLREGFHNNNPHLLLSWKHTRLCYSLFFFILLWSTASPLLTSVLYMSITSILSTWSDCLGSSCTDFWMATQICGSVGYSITTTDVRGQCPCQMTRSCLCTGHPIKAGMNQTLTG